MGLFSRLFGSAKVTEPAVPPPPVAPTPTPAPKPAGPAPSLGNVVWKRASFPFEAVGESNYRAAFVSICGKRTADGHDAEFDALLEPEPTNRFDKNAIKVMIKGQTVGYLPRDQAVRVGEQMREAGFSALRCKARIQGGWYEDADDQGDFGVRLAMPKAGQIEFA